MNDLLDQKKLDAIGKKIRVQLEALLQLARDAGIARPMLYIESEHGVYIMDQDHPEYSSEHHGRARSIVGRTMSALPDDLDVGAW